MSPPKVGVIILNLNGKSDTLECLESLQHVDYDDLEIIVVDNGSIDNSILDIKKRFPAMTLLEMKTNLGFSGGNNEGIRYALQEGCAYVLLLNNDTVIDPDAIKAFVAAFEGDQRLGVAQGKIFVYDKPDIIWNLGASVHLGGAWMWPNGRFQVDRGQFEQVRDIGFASGCTLFMSKGVLEKVGLLDDRFFFTGEDADFSIRARAAGYRVLYLPHPKVWHKIGVTGNRLVHCYFSSRNRILLLRKHTSPALRSLALIVHLVWSMVSMFNMLVWKRNPQGTLASVKGLWDGLAGKYGEGRLQEFIDIGPRILTTGEKL